MDVRREVGALRLETFKASWHKDIRPPPGPGKRDPRQGAAELVCEARLPDVDGLVFEQTRCTFRQIAQRIDDAGKRLIAAGVGHGDHVALWLDNCDSWIFVGFAVHKIGAVLVPMNTHFRSRDMAYVLKQSDSRFRMV
jgi:acyl-CoA synthetase (AMP-forming)/AMP-acid ligase II